MGLSWKVTRHKRLTSIVPNIFLCEYYFSKNKTASAFPIIGELTEHTPPHPTLFSLVILPKFMQSPSPSPPPSPLRPSLIYTLFYCDSLFCHVLKRWSRPREREKSAEGQRSGKCHIIAILRAFGFSAARLPFTKKCPSFFVENSDSSGFFLLFNLIPPLPLVIKSTVSEARFEYFFCCFFFFFTLGKCESAWKGKGV